MTDTWILCKDRYPEVQRGYLVEVVAINMDDDVPTPFVCHYDGGLDRGFELLHVTHWCPLPERYPEWNKGD